VKLDLAYRHAGLVLCDTCRVTMQDLTLSNARRGTGSALDFIVGDDEVGEAAVLLQDVRRHRLACTPSSSLSGVLEGTPRSKVLPPSPTGEQLFALKTVTVQVRLLCLLGQTAARLGWLGADRLPWEACCCCSGLHKLLQRQTAMERGRVARVAFKAGCCVLVVLQGVTYPDALHLIDFSEDLPLGHHEGRGHAQSAHWGGYALVSSSSREQQRSGASAALHCREIRRPLLLLSMALDLCLSALPLTHAVSCAHPYTSVHMCRVRATWCTCVKLLCQSPAWQTSRQTHV
jgi:hypothetical protein